MTATLQLSEEQQQQLDEHGDRPIRVVHPKTAKTYFLVASDLYERLRPLFDDETFDIRDTYAAQDKALAKVWDDPELDVYNKYDSRKP